MRRALVLTLLVAFVVAFTPFVQADEAERSRKRKEPIAEGVAWLKKAQAADGSWDYNDGPFAIGIHMKQGTTAFAALALLKSGVVPDDPVINKAFEFIHGC